MGDVGVECARGGIVGSYVGDKSDTEAVALKYGGYRGDRDGVGGDASMPFIVL